MSTLLRSESYVKSDLSNNNNKFWIIEIYDDNSVITKFGRVGDSGQQKVKNFSSSYDAQRFWDSKIKEKTTDGRNGEIAYRKIDVVGNVSTSDVKVKNIAKQELTKIATSQIKTNNPIVEDLIKYLTKVNVHNISEISGGQITYNDTTGLFSTPLGIVTQSNIDEANDILVKISDIVAKRDYDNKEIVPLTNSLLMLVPQNIGRGRLDVRNFWSDLSKIQYQKQILDSLQASYSSAISNPNKDTVVVPEKKVFDVDLNLVTDRKITNDIFDNYNKRRSTMHSCYNYRPVQVWSVNIKPVKDAFMLDGAKLDNIINGYHGTSSANLLSLLKSGFLVQPPSSAYISGKLFGSGIYSAPSHVNGSSTKATNYSVGYWGGNKNDRVFVFILKMAMGKFFTPTERNYTRISYPQHGFDSTWAKANYSGVKNDECIVYRSSQVDIEYLIELK